MENLSLEKVDSKDMAYFNVTRQDDAVVFGPESTHRRRSSIQDFPDGSNFSRRQAEHRSNTSCIVHQLLDAQRKSKQTHHQLQNIEESSPKNGQNGSLDQQIPDPRDEAVKHSRLLTKKQLSAMAMGVRDLAKKLKHLKIKLNIRSVFVITKIHDDELISLTQNLTRWLLHRDRSHHPYIVYVEDTLKDNEYFDVKSLLAEDPSYEGRLKYWDEKIARRHPHTFDFVITLGGDGTVLYASWLFQRVVPPVLSFALGSLGFLTKFDFEQYEEILTRAFKEGVTVSLRLRFEGTIMRSQHRKKKEARKPDLVEELIGEEAEDGHTHKPDRTFEILNDIVVDRGPNPTMSSIELFGDAEHFTTVQADGVCVATPTGSTAYNLAAGGSLCHPENPVILVSAICAHTLSFRPIILPDTIVLRVGVPYDARTGSWASFDGRERIALEPGDYVTISASRYPFANVMPEGSGREEWIQSISTKLQWNSRQRQKAFSEKEKSKSEDEGQKVEHVEGKRMGEEEDENENEDGVEVKKTVSFERVEGAGDLGVHR
ncbi:MAG: hypothetical protein Q9227_005550 [Pyrenula ochraceoflavens]